jgi:hypothetical protein
MKKKTWSTWQVEHAAVLAVQRSLLLHTNFIDALPSIDRGIDLLAFRPDPFASIPIQVKGTQSGLKVYSKHSSPELLVAYVLDPLSNNPRVCLMQGCEAWNLPFEYIERGGSASDHSEDNGNYRWASITKLLRTMLLEHEASEERWEHYLKIVNEAVR